MIKLMNILFYAIVLLKVFNENWWSEESKCRILASNEKSTDNQEDQEDRTASVSTENSIMEVEVNRVSTDNNVGNNVIIGGNIYTFEDILNMEDDKKENILLLHGLIGNRKYFLEDGSDFGIKIKDTIKPNRPVMHNPNAYFFPKLSDIVEHHNYSSNKKREQKEQIKQEQKKGIENIEFYYENISSDEESQASVECYNVSSPDQYPNEDDSNEEAEPILTNSVSDNPYKKLLMESNETIHENPSKEEMNKCICGKYNCRDPDTVQRIIHQNEFYVGIENPLNYADSTIMPLENDYNEQEQNKYTFDLKLFKHVPVEESDEESDEESNEEKKKKLIKEKDHLNGMEENISKVEELQANRIEKQKRKNQIEYSILTN